MITPIFSAENWLKKICAFSFMLLLGTSCSTIKKSASLTRVIEKNIKMRFLFQGTTQIDGAPTMPNEEICSLIGFYLDSTSNKHLDNLYQLVITKIDTTHYFSYAYAFEGTPMSGMDYLRGHLFNECITMYESKDFQKFSRNAAVRTIKECSTKNGFGRKIH